MSETPHFQAAFPASQNTGSGWGVVVFFATQFAQIFAGAAAMAIFLLVTIHDPLAALSTINIVVLGYLLIAVTTGYPLIAMAITAFYRRPWAPLLHLAATLLAGQAFITQWFTRPELLGAPIQIPLIIGPAVGYLVFRYLAKANPPGTISAV